MSMRFPIQLLVPPTVLFLFLAGRCGSDNGDAASAASGSSPASTSGPKIYAAKFCPALFPKIKAYVKAPLDSIMQSGDAFNDDMHLGDVGYVSCTFGHAGQGYVVTVSMHAGDVSKYTGITDKGYSALPGFGDQARAYDGSLRWVDVVKGSTACEAILTIADADLAERDWKQAAGKVCNAAFDLYHA